MGSSQLLNPNAGAMGLPHCAAPDAAAHAFTLGDHVADDDIALQTSPIAGAHPTARSSRGGGGGAAVRAGASLTDGVGRQFSPYEDNGGTVASVSGDDYTIVASDTRLGSYYSIPSRNVSRVIKLTDKVVLASSGMQSDIAVLHKVLKIRLTQYKFNHHKDMTLTALSQMLSTVLYYRRFQPYYTFNVLGGIDEEGKLPTSPRFLPTPGRSAFFP